jgi:3-hydroxyacyl-CoA dehydrogenase
VTSINPAADLSIDGEVAIVTINSPPVNALSQIVRDGLKRGVEAAKANRAVKAIVITCGGRTFIAGADISEFGKPPAKPYLPEVLDTIENASKPVVAALHGTALGGGFEVALTAHRRPVGQMRPARARQVLRTPFGASHRLKAGDLIRTFAVRHAEAASPPGDQ